MSVSSLARFLQAMKSTSVKIHLLWNRVGLCVLGSDCVAKERGRRSLARKRENAPNCSNMILRAFKNF